MQPKTTLGLRQRSHGRRPSRDTSESAHAPTVAPLLALYHHPDRKLSRPAERMVQIIAQLDGMIRGPAQVSGVVDGLIRNDFRRYVFLLEGLARLYEDKFGEPISNIEEESKAIEDLLGQYTFHQGLVQTARERQFPPQVVAVLERQRTQVRGKLEAKVAARWFPNARGEVPALRDALESVLKLDFGKVGEDRDYLAHQIAKYMEDSASSSFDLSSIEGLHHLRRRMRWGTVYFEATQGLVQASEKLHANRALDQFVNDPVASSKYTQLPSPKDESKAIVIPQGAYVANMKWVLDLGAIKDAGEPIPAFIEAFLAAGCAKSPAAARERVLQLLGPEARPEALLARGRQIYSQVKSSDLFESLQHAFEEPHLAEVAS